MLFKPEDFIVPDDSPEDLDWPQGVMSWLANKKLQEWAMKTERFDNGNVTRERVRQIRLRLKILRHMVKELSNEIERLQNE